MTKLTKEQIEQERVKFEEWYKIEFDMAYDFGALVKNSDNTYKSKFIDRFFEGWLARAELDKGE